MSDLGSEIIMTNAKGMNEEDVKAFLTQVDRHLLVGELDRRLEKAEKRENALKDLALEN